MSWYNFLKDVAGLGKYFKFADALNSGGFSGVVDTMGPLAGKVTIGSASQVPDSHPPKPNYNPLPDPGFSAGSTTSTPSDSSGNTASSIMNQGDVGNTDYGFENWEQAVDTLTSWLSGLFASTNQIQQDNRKFNAEQAEAQRRYLTYMSDTQFQRAVEDLRKAKLNPILALGGSFSGASVPTAAASGSNNSVAGDTVGSLLGLIAPLIEAISSLLPTSAAKAASGIFLPSGTSGFGNNYGYR